MIKILTGLLLTMVMTSVLQAGQIDDFKKKCSTGNGDACATLGALYSGLAKRGVVKKDMEKAKEYWKRGCDLGSGSSCTTSAMFIEDEDARIAVLKKACDLKNENGCLSYRQTIKLKRLRSDCLEKSDANSCSQLAGEVFLSGDYKTGKALFRDLCKMGDGASCNDAKVIEGLEGFRKLTLADQLSKECSDKKDKYACEKLGTFLIEINSFVTSKAKTKEEKQEKVQEVMMNMTMAQIYLKEACKLGRKESCRTLTGLKKALEK